MTDILDIAGKQFVIERVYLDDPNQPPFFGCGVLPLRRNRADLIRDIERAQRSEWRGPLK
jgi:hypothetical protein